MAERAKQPNIDPHEVAIALHKGLTPWRIKLSIKDGAALLSYDYHKKGDDRASLEVNQQVVAALLGVCSSGVIKKTSLQEAWEILDGMYERASRKTVRPTT
eukprot:8236100-Alexandrium_andersonii.AAC.1